ncbi:stage V sporulation protein E [Caproiciproducens sp. MSJ-32]|uniref:stage V sporulation protein E n=1 Tax=Caproiciproducens sp. MSJ-32 TaxID=2841527 RepID=UPI001C10B7BF|nr:stage V sporulation protein E [Caproiciproducens sp. MSJ-32]MBU5454313.1 stage V sporulation protein E [Caproiciproducens sp. MSJ-32]
MNNVRKINSRKKKNNMKSIDYGLLCVIFLLLFVGIIMVYSSSSYYALYEKNSPEYFFIKEIIWTIVGVCAMLFTMAIDYHNYKKITGQMFIITLIFLVLVLFIGAEVNGARRWIRLGPLSFQPSELAKYVLVIYLAKQLDRKNSNINKFFKGVVFYLGISAIFAGLVLLEKNLSITAIIMIVAVIMLFVGGAKIIHLLPIIPAGLSAGIALIFVAPYRLKRLTAFMNPWADPSGDSYQLIQSIYALGSGGFFGVGLGNSRQKALFMPEPHNDFIFAILGEEFGFIGCIFVILLFMYLIYKGVYIAIKAKDNYGFLLATGIVSIISIQAVINIAVVSGSMPVTGVPLPLISYGGTSLVINLIALGVLLNISRQSKDVSKK